MRRDDFIEVRHHGAGLRPCLRPHFLTVVVQRAHVRACDGEQCPDPDPFHTDSPYA
jgi:hypothetical protein